MKEPRRWMDDAQAPEVVRDLLQGARSPIPMSVESRARGHRTLRRVAMLPVGLAAWIGAKGAVAAMGAFAATSATTFFVLESQKAPEPPPPEAHLTEPAPRTARPAASPLALWDSEGVDPEATEEGLSAPPLQEPATEPATEPGTPAAQGKGGRPLPAASADRDDLLEESRLLEIARRELASDPAAALSRSGEHARRYPKGQLASERALIEIDALRRLGRAAEARGRAEAFLVRQPDGLYADRVRKLLGSLER
jgi:hypothetical protein